MRRNYHVFVGSQYYPSQGLGDYVGMRETEEEALILAANTEGDWWFIAEETEVGLQEFKSGDRGNYS